MRGELARQRRLVSSGCYSRDLVSFTVYREPVACGIECVVLFVESRELVGVGVGQLDGGIHESWPAETIPLDLRRPNARFWIVLSGYAT